MEALNIYSAQELRTIQTIELNTLKVIIELCEQEHIEYFLIGGSTLGAIRHGGFIPWDDDIDIGMLRPHFERFLAVAAERLPQGYSLQSPYDKHSAYYYAKVRVDGTEFVEYCNRTCKMHRGIYVDVFAFDEVPDDDKENQKHFNRFQRLIRIFSLRQSPDVSRKPQTGKEKCISGIRFVLHLLTKCIPHRMIHRSLLRCQTKWNGSEQQALACMNFPVRKTEYIKKEDLYPLIDWKFETMNVKIPREYDTYLKTHYGDYMKLPPKEKQFGHKPYLVNLGKFAEGEIER